MLRVQAFDKSDERASAIIRCKERGRILASQGIVRMVFNGLCEEAAVKVENSCVNHRSELRPERRERERDKRCARMMNVKTRTYFLNGESNMALHRQLHRRLDGIYIRFYAAESRDAQ